MATWGEAGRQVARESLWIDFAFMPAYALLCSGLTVMAARATRGRTQTLGFGLLPASFTPWLLDATENVALLTVLRGPADPAGVALALAGGAAATKFALMFLSLVYSWPILVSHWTRHLAHGWNALFLRVPG